MPLREAASRVAGHLASHEFVDVYAHHDADGIAAGVIVCTAILRNGGHFRLRVVDHLSPADISPDFPALLSDIGSGLEGLQDDVMIIDHHPTRFSGELQLNPRLVGIMGSLPARAKLPVVVPRARAPAQAKVSPLSPGWQPAFLAPPTIYARPGIYPA